MDPKAFFIRYRPYLAIVAAVVALVWFMPGGGDGDAQQASAGGPIAGDAQQGSTGTMPVAAGDTPGAAGPSGSPSVGGTSAATDAGTVTAGGNEAVAPPPADAGANCDPKTGRIKVPTIYAPPCVPAFSGDNGGSTYQGVTKDSITVTYFQPESDPAVDAALTAAGANNTPEEQAATMRDYVEYFNKNYETYGRKVKLIVRKGSGDTEDDAVGRADALAIATEDKAFAVFGSPVSNKFIEELAAHHVLCICTTSQPQELYERLAPYLGYTPLMASTQGYIHRAEYIGKRLNGRPAKYAGSSDGVPLSTNKRKFGLLWYETPEHAYAQGITFFVKELKEKYGITLAENLSYPSDYAQVSERARPLIQRLKSAAVTSVIFAGDPIAPAIFTKEATRQLYFPEWIITGSALTDTTLFARTFDQQQWDKAFGVSFLTARSPKETGDAFKLHMWQFGRPPVANNQFGVIYPTPFTFFTGVHLAGPNLTVQSWQAGLFSYPLTGAGRKTSAATSYGNHGIWPFVDYTNLDDVTEIWWDPREPGEDEVGNQGVGMYRYVDGGVRYLPGKHPTTDPKAFVTEGTVTVYDEAPPGEESPEYPPPPH
jgi:hypothetical protein